MILAYARGVLSQDGCAKIASHITGCKECTDVLTLSKKSLKAEQEFKSYRKQQDREYISDFDREIKRIQGRHEFKDE